MAVVGSYGVGGYVVGGRRVACFQGGPLRPFGGYAGCYGGFGGFLLSHPPVAYGGGASVGSPLHAHAKSLGALSSPARATGVEEEATRQGQPVKLT